MEIEKKFNKESGKTSWTFDKWTLKMFFWLGLITFWFYVACFAIGVIQGIWEM